MAGDLENHTEEMLAYYQELVAARESLDKSVLPLIDDEQQQQRQGPAAMAQFMESVSGFRRSVDTIRKGVMFTKDSTEGLDATVDLAD